MRAFILILIASLSALAQTATFNNVRINGVQQNSDAALSSLSRQATNVFTFGDSFTQGAGASSDSARYPNLIASRLQLPLVNLGIGGSQVHDVAWMMLPGNSFTNSGVPYQSPSAIDAETFSTVMVGFNDVRSTQAASSTYRRALDHVIAYLTIPDASKRFASAPDSSTGTWTGSTWVGYTNRAVTSSSGTLTFTNVMGSEIYVGYLAWATNYGGTISIAVDGFTAFTFDTANATYGNRDYYADNPSFPAQVGPYGTGSIDFAANLARISNLQPGPHSVVVTASGGDVTVFWCAGNDFPRTPGKGPSLVVGGIPVQAPWNSSGSNARHLSFNQELLFSVSSFRTAGLDVQFADTTGAYIASIHQGPDAVHPNDAGHAALAEQFVAAASRPQGAVGYFTQTDFSSITATNVSALNLSGSQLVMTPTASANGTTHRFGPVGATNTAVEIISASTAADRRIVVTGNAITCRFNSTSTSANMTVGSSGVSVVLPQIQIPSITAGTIIRGLRHGVATLSGSGTATVTDTAVTANTRIFLTSNTDGGTPGWVRVSARTAGANFTITSSSTTDTSTVAWFAVEP